MVACANHSDQQKPTSQPMKMHEKSSPLFSTNGHPVFSPQAEHGTCDTIFKKFTLETNHYSLINFQS